MNLEKAIEQLEDLKSCCDEFDAVEIMEEDKEALTMAIEALKRNDQEKLRFVPETSDGICKDTKCVSSPWLEPLNTLEEICGPIIEYLIKNHDPHCSVIISDNQIKLIRTEIGIPVKRND